MLHQLAKRLIADGINTASRGGTPYNVEVRCAQHPGGVLTTINLAPPGTAADVIANTERSAAPGTVADILVVRPNEPPLAIEVVVTHDLDTTKIARYAEQDIDWIRVKLDRTPVDPLAELIELSAGLEVDRLDVRTTPACPQCSAQVNDAYNDTGEPPPHAGPQLQPASRNLMTYYVADHHVPELPRTLQIRRAYVEIQPGDCIIGIFTGVDIPGAGHTPAGAAPRWNFEDPATGVGIWPTRLNPDAYRSMVGRLCILTCRQEGISQSTGNRRFHFNLAQWPDDIAPLPPDDERSGDNGMRLQLNKVIALVLAVPALLGAACTADETQPPAPCLPNTPYDGYGTVTETYTEDPNNPRHGQFEVHVDGYDESLEVEGYRYVLSDLPGPQPLDSRASSGIGRRRGARG